EQDIGGDAGVRREHAVGQPHDGMKIELLEKFFLDAGANTVAEQCSVRHDHGGARRMAYGGRLALELAHNELKEQKRGFRRLAVFGEIALNAFFFLAAKWRICEDYIDALFFADFRKLESKGVAG